jgi:hypothetical protein
MRWKLAWLAIGLSACDVEASLGAQDGGFDAFVADASGDANDAASTDAGADANDAGTDASDAGADANESDTSTVDAAVIDVGPPDAGECAPPDASACLQCQAVVCCPVYAPCVHATNCRCIVDCVLSGGTSAGCTTHCGADHGESAPLITCAQNHCACP